MTAAASSAPPLAEPRGSDVRVTSARAAFRPVTFREPLHLSSGPITSLTEARVTVTVERRDGTLAEGLGSVLLSYPWAGGTDAGMRSAVGRFMEVVVRDRFADPLQHGARLLDEVGRVPGPRLAAEVALGPVDQAVHDAWAQAAGLSAFTMYDERFLDADLGHYLGTDFAGRWPSEWLLDKPARCLPVQYVLGVDDPIERAAHHQWIKVKLSGDVTKDIRRVTELTSSSSRLSLDPNEAYSSADDVHRLLSRVTAEYVEQPVPRGSAGPGQTVIPVLADEGLPDCRRLDELTGWNGIVVKTCRGQTSALLSYCWARLRGRYVVQQDLTHVGPALAHAAVFASHCQYSVRAFECNSLKFAPDGNTELERERPGLVHDHGGWIEVSASGVGIR
jgi:L-alanine-DL-glutamate epimerase-like enolase superfamily enzyme